MRSWAPYIRSRLTPTHPAPDESVVLEWAQHAEAAFAAARADEATEEEADARVCALIDEWCAHVTGLERRPHRSAAVDPPPAGSRGFTGVWQDFRYGVRLLARQPGFAAVATLLIAVGVGATTTLSSLTYAVLLKPLPWPDADRIVRLTEHREGETHSMPNTITNATYLAWVDAPQTIEALAGYESSSTSTMTVRGQASRVRVASATASLFAVIPARRVAGRLFTAAEQPVGANQVIVLAEDLARRLYTSASSAIGQNLDLDGTTYRVVGVVGREFGFPTSEVAAWIPLDIPPVVHPDGQGRSLSMLSGVARLKPGVAPEAVAAEGTARAKNAPEFGLVGMAVFGTKNKPTVRAVRYLESLTADVRPALFVIVAGVSLLFLVAIANVAGMQLARTTTRRREVAIRSALGAAPGRLARQLLTENLAIGALGGAAGWLLSMALHQLLPRLLPASFPRLDGFRADWRVTLFAIGSAIVAGVVFGTFPALIARRQNLVEALVEDSLAPAGGGTRTRIGRLRAVILASQVAIAALLLTGASLFGRSFLALLDVDRGYEPHNLATVTLAMPDQQFTGRRRAEILDVIVERLAHTPGVAAAAASSVMPLLPYDQMMGFQLPPGPGRPQMTVARAEGRLVSPAYFAAMGMRLLKGRGFNAADSPTSRMVVVVNETFVRRYLPGESLGATVPFSYVQESQPTQEVVGVVDDVRQHGATDPPQPEIFFDYRQMSVGMIMSTPVVMARTAGDPARLLPTIERLAQEAEPGLVADSAMTMDDRLVTSLAQPRLYALLFAAFAAFALLVAGAGLFGVLSYSVAQRTREIGVRTALGARPVDIAALVVRQALTITVAGSAIGLVAAFLLVTLVGTMLYGVTAHDGLTFALVPVAILLIAAVACYSPARRAAAISPLRMLSNR
jgi:putative ABC transport system permease protein